MEDSHFCASCETPLQPQDGHDRCPACLGPEHLREALSDNPCMNCSYLPRAVRIARLAEVEHPDSNGDLPPSGQPTSDCLRRSKRRAVATAVAPTRKKGKSDRSSLSSKVQQLSAELAQVRSMLRDCQPAAPVEEEVATFPPMPVLVPEDDALSLAASATHFQDYEEDLSDVSERSSHSSVQSCHGCSR